MVDRRWLDVAVRWLAYLLFYSYVLLLVIAGAWGALFAPVDLDWLIGLDLPDHGDQSRANMLSQYRFLRAVEFGVGVMLLVFRKQIFSVELYNRLFLIVLGAGILARVISIPIDGSPAPIFYLFMISELLGLIAIYVHTRRTGWQDRDELSAARPSDRSTAIGGSNSGALGRWSHSERS